MKLNFKLKIVPPVLILVVIGLAISGFISNPKLKVALGNAIGSQMVSTTEFTKSVMDSWAENRYRDVAAWSSLKSSKQVEELGKEASEIDKVVETITDISEQVNLLPLNATMEAARAGEAGKGFVVVANEIKELAKQTASTTGEIKEKVQRIQRSTENTIYQINKISRVVNDVSGIISTIAAVVEEQSATTREIAQNVTQASLGINEVNENVSQANTVSTRASELAELADTLNKTVSRFKV